MKKYGIETKSLALSDQEAEKCWDLSDEKKEGTLKKEMLKVCISLCSWLELLSMTEIVRRAGQHFHRESLV